MPTPDDWQRLGGELVRRRVSMNRDWRNRQKFAEDRNIGYHLVLDIENARRASFGRPVLAELEIAYGLEPGAFDRFFAGGELESSDPPPPRWHLGTVLIRTRINLDRRYQDRKVFSHERSVPYALAVALEDKERAQFTASEIQAAANAYGLSPGEIENLGDGELEILQDVTGPAAAEATLTWLASLGPADFSREREALTQRMWTLRQQEQPPPEDRRQSG